MKDPKPTGGPLDVHTERWRNVTAKLPSGWHVDDVYDIPQFGMIRVRASRGTTFEAADVPVSYDGPDLDGRIVAALSDLIARTRTAWRTA